MDPDVSKKLNEFMPLVDDFTKHPSDTLQSTTLPAGGDPRAFYLEHPLESPPPLIVHSDFVSSEMVQHLMRDKKDSALAVKFVQGNSPPDRITNIEGALHTFVTPIVLVKMHGDYRFRGGHGVVRFLNNDETQQARRLILSAAVQPDFEDHQVMLTLSALGEEEVVGQPLPHDFSTLDTASKQDSSLRAKYDARLRSHIIAHLLQDSRLPALREISSSVRTVEECCQLIETLIVTDEPQLTASSLQGVFLRLPGRDVVSAEILASSAFHQARNEIAALELICSQGYVYTVDPPSIFARELGATLLNRFQILALKRLVASNAIKRMKIFAFNDYADPGALPLLECVFKSHDILVLAKADLFGQRGGAYSPHPSATGAMLVIHNNSDGFGQNVETEHDGGSLDGAIGANSSAAASLKRDRNDLTSYRIVM